MTIFEVSIEISDEEVVMGHIPSLPGCHARGSATEEAVLHLAAAVRDYHVWLADHGEAVVMPDETSIQITEVIEGTGPHHPGNRSALFRADSTAMTLVEMESSYLPRAEYMRADLLALVTELSDSALDWQPAEEAMSIRRILRHIGNSEEWYVSRIVAPASLPPQWENDADMPLFDFLAMERETAFARLRSLSSEELTRVTTPTHFTSNPGEQWTARKALRRLLEHEREHLAHIREVLSAYDEHER